MGQVAFWGNAHGQVATTANVVASATIIGLEYALRTLVAHTHWSRSTLESAFLKYFTGREDSLITFNDTGLDALERLARSGRLTPEIIQDYTNPILKDRLDLLTGTTKPDEAMFESIHEVIQGIFYAAKQFYNLTLLDLNSGQQNQLSMTMLQGSDLIVVNLNQNINLLERFFSKEDWPEILNEKPFIVVLGSYDPQSKYSAQNIARRFRYKDPIYTVPYCTDFLDALNDRKVLDFFLRNRSVTKLHDNYFFMQEIRRLARAIVDHLGLNLEMDA
ncbi:chromosome partitioning protein ParA [Tumebacillus sp. ITR2]|uniref:Chromosome partitioning protein ParA n=1 Tax=Tumebacillus amylolyticus TaxID=2801339 RepID=A0ABS1J6E0_9BACL|nr:chromosome partitioning protein ParA [Tumebacillus amylolyticus]MBL0385847.1 chromosome partitioning protein ParA [Tumebacillus amylolyticus]